MNVTNFISLHDLLRQAVRQGQGQIHQHSMHACLLANSQNANRG